MSVVRKQQQQNMRTNKTMIVLMLQAGLAAPTGRVWDGGGAPTPPTGSSLPQKAVALAGRGHSVETREQSDVTKR